jgi:hypothetical protein
MAGIPRVAGVIAAISDDGHRAKALEAAERSYCQTILDSGYMGAVARTWRFIILFRLQMELKDQQLAKWKLLGRLDNELRRTGSAALQELLELMKGGERQPTRQKKAG